MSVWDTYQGRMAVRGETRRETVLKREKRNILSKLPDNLSYQTVTVFDQEHGYNITDEEVAKAAVSKNIAVINSDNLNEKYIFSLPDEDIEHGSLVRWMDNYWLVTERDANMTVYTRAKMIQCNHLLRWVSEDDKICEQWCIIEDGTKYLTGEYEDRYFVVTRGDSRIAMTLARNSETVRLNRKNRFIIDDEESTRPLAYLLTKPLKLGWSFNQQGVFKFVLQEVTTTDDDNLDLRIADYYLHFPKQTDANPGGESGSPGDEGSEPDNPGKKVWL
ncbi:MAG: hypothetical protein J6Y20_14505 [Lachnospiraceae bacterium]|nr:hypothetical protein [Lachnospiraceae bacterium]